MLRIAAIVAFVLLTNAGFLQRLVLLVGQGRYGTLVGFVGLWCFSFVALLIAVLQPKAWLRIGWALVLALATAVGAAFAHSSGNELGVFDVLSLWNARHEAERAFEFYTGDLIRGVLLFALGVAVMAMPPVPKGAFSRRWLTRLAWVPAMPVAFIAAIILMKEGGGTQALPTQFSPLAVVAVVGSKIVHHPVPERSAVAWTPGQKKAGHILFLVDESVRADFIDWTPGNPFTPELARLKPRIVDFGPATSGGNCSHYSNAILRFVAGRDQIGPKLLTNPTIWQYAKKAGFRTVYIDAQAAFNRSLGKLQNFMTVQETRDIDGFYALDASTPVAELDDKLLDIVEQEIKSEQPVFIYANKNGAHFPYDHGYPAEQALQRPTMSEVDDNAGRQNSYRNVVRWSVDRIFQRLFAEANLEDTTVIYTSDHGQNLEKGRLTHCSVENPDSREALVPLFTITQDADLRARFAAAAEASLGRASHFEIGPTLLELFGYAHRDVSGVYHESLLEKDMNPPAFTTGDIFGLFASTARWHPVNPLAAASDAMAKGVAEPEPHSAVRMQPAETSVIR